MPGDIFFSPLFPAWLHFLAFLGEVLVAKQTGRAVLEVQGSSSAKGA